MGDSWGKFRTVLLGVDALGCVGKDRVVDSQTLAVIEQAIDPERLVRSALRLMAVHSPTGLAGHAADCLAQQLTEDGFVVERPVAGHAAAPAVVARWSSGRP